MKEKITAGVTQIIVPLTAARRTGAAKKILAALDLEPVKFKLVTENGWSVMQADRVALLYKGFLWLHVLYPRETHIPTREIDEMWHAHILDTAKYMADCHALFGYYLHHFPYMGLRGAADATFADEAFLRTRQRFMAVCGVDPLTGAAMAAADCSSSCSSSSCGSTGGDTPAPSTDNPDGGPAENGNTDKGNTDKGNNKGGGKARCTTHIPFNDPARGTDNTPRRNPPPAGGNTPPAPRRPLWRRILGLSAPVEGRHDEVWQLSVDPQAPLAQAIRPGRDELLLRAEGAPAGVTKH